MSRDGMPIEGFNSVPEPEAAPAPKKRGPKPGSKRNAPARAPRATAAMRPELTQDAARESVMRPQGDMRTSLQEADDYAAQILESYGDTIDQTDEYYISPDSIPEGWAYEWKRQAVAEKEDNYYMNGLIRAGWRDVPASRHPEFMQPGYQGAIIKKGLRLMEKPKVLVDRALQMQTKEARQVKRNSEAILYDTPPGTLERDAGNVGRKNFVKKDIVGPPQRQIVDVD